MGKLWGDLCENQDENWPRYNGTALYSCFMQISHVSCIWPSGCPCLFILNTRHNSIEGISFFPGSLGYCKPRFIPTNVFMFWNRNLVFKLTTIDVPSGLQTRNFHSSLSKIWSSWRSTFCDVITTCKYSSVHSVPDVLIVLFPGSCCLQLVPIPRLFTL